MQHSHEIKKIGLFLGVEPHAGGMFQYAQSLLEALNALPQYEVTIACASEAWVPLLIPSPAGLDAEQRRGSGKGQACSNADTSRKPAPHLTSPLWGEGFNVLLLKRGRLGLLIANIMMAARIPGVLTRAFSFLNPIPRQLKRAHCDIWIFPAQDALSYQVNVPVIATVHDLMHRYEPHFPEVSRFATREHRFKNLTRYASAILVDSNVGKEHVVESYGTPPGKIFPLPYIPPKTIFESQERPDFDAHYRLPQKFFFYPAQFWAHKNHRALIDAAASLSDIHLVFTGGKRYEYEAIAAHAKAKGVHVTFPGYVPDADLPGFYRRARALIMPTFFGPTNIPPLEAMALGCPVAISGTYGMPEQSGDAALYFHPRSIPQMAEAMQRLWYEDALCEQLRAHGTAKIAAWGQAQFNARLHEILKAVRW